MRLGLALITFLATLAAVSPAQAAGGAADVSNDRWVEVTGEGSVSAAPDFARVTLGVTSTGKNAGEAMAANAKAANALVSLIKSEGVAPADIQTSEMSISPVFSQASPGQQTAPTITGYSVSNNVAVTLRDIPRLGALLDKARPLAVADARRKAEIYANAGGARIGRLMVLTEEPGRQPPVAFSRAYAASAAAPTPIEAGEDKLTVTVLARF